MVLNHLPTKILQLGNSANNFLEKLFPYAIVIVNYNDDEISKKLLINLRCPICDRKVHYNDLWNKKRDLKVSFIRTCHHCNRLFLLSGRYTTESEFDVAFTYFDFNVYNKDTRKKGINASTKRNVKTRNVKTGGGKH